MDQIEAASITHREQTDAMLLQ